MLIRPALQDRPALMFDGLEGESTQSQIRYFMGQLQAAAGAKMARVRDLGGSAAAAVLGGTRRSAADCLR